MSWVVAGERNLFSERRRSSRFPLNSGPTAKARILDRDTSADFRRWEAPRVDLETGIEGRDPRTMTTEELDALSRQAHERGFQKGRWEGLEAGHAEISAQVERLGQLMQALAAPLKQVDAEVEHELVQLAAAIAEQVVLRELATSPEVLLSLVKQAIAEIRDSSRPVALHLNPDDARMLRHNLPSADETERWQIVEDTALASGEIRVTAGDSIVDAGVHTRVASLVAQSLRYGGEPVEKGPQQDFWSDDERRTSDA